MTIENTSPVSDFDDLCDHTDAPVGHVLSTTLVNTDECAFKKCCKKYKKKGKKRCKSCPKA